MQRLSFAAAALAFGPSAQRQRRPLLCDYLRSQRGEPIGAQGVTGLFADAMHPYTAALLAALPERSQGRLLPTIPGVVPGVLDRPAGCLFNPRCTYATAQCRLAQPAFAHGPRGRVRCHYPLTGGVPGNHPGTAGLAA